MNDKKPKLSRFFGFDFSSKLIIDKKDKNIRKEIKILCFIEKSDEQQQFNFIDIFKAKTRNYKNTIEHDMVFAKV